MQKEITFKPQPQIEDALWDLALFFYGQPIPAGGRDLLLKDHALMEKLALRLSEVVGKAPPWTGQYPINVLGRKIGPSKLFGEAVLALVTSVDNVSIPDAYQGAVSVSVFALPGRVAPGALILGKSIDCARPACRVKFVPRSGNQKYHSAECGRLHRKEIKEQSQ